MKKNILIIFLSCLLPLVPLSALASEAPQAKSHNHCKLSLLRPDNNLTQPSDPGLELQTKLLPNLTAAKDNQAAGATSGEFDLGSREGLTALTFRNPSGVNPYLGAGVASTDGAKKDTSEANASVPQEGNVYAYEVGAGIGCNLDKSTKLNFGYRYATNAGSVLTQEDALNRDLSPVNQGHQISMGIQVGF